MHRDVLIDCSPFLLAIIASLVALRLLSRFSGVSWRLANLRGLHADERGAVQSLSFVLTLPVFVMLMLFVVQLSQLTIARITVEYAAYAAARSATVWIPANLGDDLEMPNCIGVRAWRGEVRDEEGNFFDIYSIIRPSRKLEKIELAAATALMPICPSRGVTNIANSNVPAATSIEKAYVAMAPSSSSNSRIGTRIRNKLAYALENTVVEIEVRHRQARRVQDEPPLMWHDIGPHREEFERNEIGWQDQILVSVTHDFALLPGPGRFLAKKLIAPGRGSDPVSERIRQQGNVFVYPLTATVRLSNEGEKSVLPFIQPWALGSQTSS